ncbi:MAG: hypothetical protein A2747_01990 [Candidatus Yonathbacteria bacterium RIFCSPHIGHO2_01_FULL_44_41]|uniref:dihydrofolate reductase n=1 Tax=Candidatus Yonathbacteria bacterium RIFCSPHIGHO2_02_FULL_44_14 TaxID=1802724 RepID=A0A1G2S982_9BACT|nr:MAG: hypothetical protein A2747_01990 [Candidatus Yonathbacteria bacterium RIFCSPHIGHO2_01_FULL_44_41]OHA81634.1 MAG: hypothetical protein A3D51_02565 [Candidatus Yonathbacteria bacterium RIFCSPHIGHO2_02_FULL_44_14]OHA81815.1 MAG: hypothetical protein A3B06_02500 [Candidatus Yonathbacteria bacterium RIFCSPLOWO2_01_FULL_43_20]
MRTFEIIAAVANGNVIGYQGEMPWGRLPNDLKHFESLTMGHSVVIGFNTLLAIGKMANRRTKLLPGRKIYVLTRNPNKLTQFPDCFWLPGVREASLINDRGRVFVAGGQDIYHQFIDHPQTRIIHITRIFANYHGDTFFPILQNDAWQIEKYDVCRADDRNKHEIGFITKSRTRPHQYEMT